MAIVPMKKIRIYAHADERGDLLKAVQRLGVIEPDKPERDEDSAANFKSRAGEIAFFDRSIVSAQNAIEILSKYSSEKKSLIPMKREISEEEYRTAAKKSDETLKKVNEINGMLKETTAIKNNIARLSAQKESYMPWKDFDVELSFGGTETASAVKGTLPSEAEPDFSEISDCVFYSEVYNNGEQKGIFVICPKSVYDDVLEVLRKNGFAYPSFALPNMTAAQYMTEIEKNIRSEETKLKNIEDDFVSKSKSLDELRVYCDWLTIRRERYEVREQLLQTRKTFMLEGYIPKKYAASVKDRLETNFECFVETEEIAEEDVPPIEFENNKFVSPVETVVEMYSMPSKNDIDPNPIMSVFYYFFFGLMLSDAGYGLLLFFGGLFIDRKYKPEGTMGKMVKMFTIGGIFTAFWGVLFGSWFGDLIPKIAEVFFGKSIGPLGIYDPVSNPIPLLILSFILGLIHLFTGMGINFYSLAKRGKLKDAIFDIGFWYCLLIGLIMIIPMAPLGTGVLAVVGKWLAIIGAVGLVLTQGRSKSNIFGRIFGGIGSLYDITSYLSDLLSYSRLLALGLATGVIAQVINTMAALGGKSVIGVIMFVIIVLAGHTMNLMINVLGAYVHTNRLQYVEFFKKFYEGGGRKFRPFARNSKYIKIKEE